jgi:hypothetical protein
MSVGDVLTVVDADHAAFLPLGSADVLTVVDADHAAFLPPGSGDVLTVVDGSHATFQPSGGGGVSTLLTNLVSAWKMGEAAGTTRVDSHGTNHLTDHGTVGQTAGKNGMAADFGVDKWLSVASNSSLQPSTSAFELVGWVNGADLGVGTCVLAARWLAGNFEYLLYYTGARFKLAIGNADGVGIFGQAQADTFGPISNNTDYLVRAQYNPSGPTIGIAVNGGALDTVTGPASMFVGTANLEFGRDEDNGSLFPTAHMNHWNYWKGRILTPTEWATLWNGGAGVVYPFTGFP